MVGLDITEENMNRNRVIGNALQIPDITHIIFVDSKKGTDTIFVRANKEKGLENG